VYQVGRDGFFIIIFGMTQCKTPLRLPLPTGFTWQG
jgi:hypothetical protein